MATVLPFHHALGLTPGCLAFADDLRSTGHVVHAPDLYEGRTFTDLNEGVAHAERVGFEVLTERGVAAADPLPFDLVYAGFSLGAMPAQRLAMTRPGARGALLVHSSAPLKYFGGVWPNGLPLQIHTMEEDSWGDVDVAREIAQTVPGAELFLYPGDRHLFTDRGLADYDDKAAALVWQRVLRFLSAIESPARSR
jgi:dienelactone hydrolase